MAGHILNGSGLQPQPNLDLYLALPAVQHEGMSEADWDAEMARMFHHSCLTRQFVDGKISPDDYQDALADLGQNPYELAEAWEEGITLL